MDWLPPAKLIRINDLRRKIFYLNELAFQLRIVRVRARICGGCLFYFFGISVA